MKRVPEPELMDEPTQARAYAEADFSEPNALFSSVVAKQLRDQTPGRLVDLGCGPGDICLRMAKQLPGWQVIGLDAGPNMLGLAQECVEQAQLTDRITLIHARLPDHGLQGDFQAVVSNSLLHHLPEPVSLWQTVAELVSPGSYVQIMDLHRPDSIARARWLVDQYAADAPEVLRQDFYNSLLAAWTIEEVRGQYERAGLEFLQLSRPTERHWMATGVVPGA